MARLKVGVLISGRGSNLQALIDACRDPTYPAEIVLVISSRPEASGLGFAASAGIPAAVIPHRDRHAFAADAEALLREQRIEIVCLAGFMRLLEPSFVEAWRDRMVNIHPSLLPAFRGLHAQRQAGQAVVPVHPDDDEERLSARILEVEHRLYPLALRLIAEGRVSVVAEKVEIDGSRIPEIAALNPQETSSMPLAPTRD